MKKGILTSLGLAAVLTLGLASVNEYREVKEVDAAVETATIDFSAQGYANQADVTAETFGDISVVFNIGTGQNPPKYYTSGAAIRTYGGNYFTVSSTGDYKITSIEITYGTSDGSNAITVDSGSFSTNKWTGNAESVKFTIGGTSGNRRIQKLGVTYSDEASAEPEQKPEAKVMALFGEYYGDGTYVKNTSINVNNAANDEVKALFHAGGNSLHRTTTYTKNQLVMTLKDNPSYSSTYGTEKIDNVDYMTHLNSAGVEDYRIANTTMEKYYVTLDDFKNGINESSYVTEETKDLTKGWSDSNGIYSSSDSAVLEAFRLFTAPLWLNSNDETENYIQYDKATVQVEKDENDVDVLVMKLYANSGNSGLLTVGAQNVFSVAYIQKGTEHTHHVYAGEYKYVDDYTCSQECLFCSDAEEREHKGGEATTEQKAVCENCGQEYGDVKQEIVNSEPSQLDLSFTGVTATSYTSWSNKEDQNGIVFAGTSAANSKSYIQLKSKDSVSGIVITNNATTLTVKKITIVWSSTTTDGRTLDVYGKSSAYTSAADLYGSNKGTKIGSIVKGTSTELTIEGDYAFIGLCMKSFDYQV